MLISRNEYYNVCVLLCCIIYYASVFMSLINNTNYHDQLHIILLIGTTIISYQTLT